MDSDVLEAAAADTVLGRAQAQSPGHCPQRKGPATSEQFGPIRQSLQMLRHALASFGAAAARRAGRGARARPAAAGGGGGAAAGGGLNLTKYVVTSAKWRPACGTTLRP